MILPHAHCITLEETPERTKRLSDHLDTESISFSLFDGINAEAMGLTTVHPYEVDGPGSGYIMPQKHTGLAMSHWLLWRWEFGLNEVSKRCGLFPTEHELNFTVLEDDAEFVPGWRDALHAITPPEDWDMILIGSCNCGDKPKGEVSPGLFKVHQPQCTHAYIVRHRALKTLIECGRKIWAPIDLALIFGAYTKLNVYTCLPRLVTQHGQEICP